MHAPRALRAGVVPIRKRHSGELARCDILERAAVPPQPASPTILERLAFGAREQQLERRQPRQRLGRRACSRNEIGQDERKISHAGVS